MSFNIYNPFRRRGRPRNEKQYRVALEYLMIPFPRPHGLLTSLAYGNNLRISQLQQAVKKIRERARDAQKNA
jgi:hypothetical protein